MSLSNTSSNWTHGSYEADRNFEIKRAENDPLRAGTDLRGLNPHTDGVNSVAIGYGFDLLEY